jgi:hypothetical protein
MSGGDRSSVPSSSAPSRSNSDAVEISLDLDKGEFQTEARVLGGTEQAVLREYIRTSNVIGKGW